MPLIREHAFADGKCVWCPATETGINRAKADNQAIAACSERWADAPTETRHRAADDFDTIRERLTALRAEQKTALAGEPPPADGG